GLGVHGRRRLSYCSRGRRRRSGCEGRRGRRLRAEAAARVGTASGGARSKRGATVHFEPALSYALVMRPRGCETRGRIRSATSLVSACQLFHRRPVSFSSSSLELLQFPRSATGHTVARMQTVGGRSHRRTRQRTEASRREAVARAEAYMRMHAGTTVPLAELCRIVGLSERSLRNAFYAVRGTGPKRCL